MEDPAIARVRLVAKAVVLLYVIAGGLWIIVTDLLVYGLVDDPVLMARLETAKSWVFVAGSAALLYVVTSRAVRALARSDAQERAILDGIADGVLVVGHDRAIASANPAAIRLLGAERADQLVGMGPEEFARRFRVSRRDGHQLAPDVFVSQRALDGETPPPYEAVIRPPGHADLIAICTGSPVCAVPGRVDAAVSIIHDITVPARLAELRDRFVASAAHSLKTPVGIIKAHVHLLRFGGAVPAESLAAIERQCGRIARLTDNLLVLARLRSNSLELHPEDIDCAEIVEAVAKEMRDASRGHALVVSVEGRPAVFADRERLMLVLRDLLDLADRGARPDTDVALTLATVERRARISVTSLPYAPVELLEVGQAAGGDLAAAGVVDGHGWPGGGAWLDIEQHVVSSLLEASGGVLRLEHDAAGRHTTSVEIPLSRQAHA